jgi:hypothetical protein
MTNKIDISQQALSRSQNVLQWAGQLEKTLEGQPTPNAVAEALVDIEVINGMQMGLQQLIEKVDQKTIGLFIDNIQKINKTLEDVRKTLQNRIAFLNNPKTSQVNALDDENTLHIRAQSIFEQLQQINEELFLENSKDIGNLAEIAKTTITQIRSQTKNKETIQLLSRAEEQLQILNTTGELFVNMGTHPVLLTPPAQTSFIFASNNQYSAEFDKFYKGQPFKRSACTSIAGYFVIETLQGKGGDGLNDIMAQGQKTNARIMQERPPQFGEHFEFLDIMNEKEFADLRQVDIPHAIFENYPLLFNVDLLKGANAFKEMLQLLNELKDHNKIKEIGTVFTARGESYGIVILAAGEIVIFDPHGHQPLTNDHRAYAVVFEDIEKAAQFLIQRIPVIQEVENLHYNTGVITPVCLKEHHLADKKRDLSDLILEPPVVDVVSPADDESQVSAMGFYKIVQALAKKSKEGFDEATGYIADLSLQKCLFAMTEKKPTNITDRIFFHIYHIHRVESPQKLDGSSNYGTKTFQNGHASPEERLRAAQRAFIEIAFAGIEDAINTRDKVTLRQFSDLLEGLNLHENDLPKGKNIAHYLFERLYFHYKDAAESNHTLTHPHDWAFKGDFGRNAFRDEVEIVIDPQFKLDVVKQVRNELKHIWRM